MARKPEEIVDRYGKDAAMDRYTKKPIAPPSVKKGKKKPNADPRMPRYSK